jgi:hypothetical protein
MALNKHFARGVGTVGKARAMGSHGKTALRRKSMGGSGG